MITFFFDYARARIINKMFFSGIHYFQDRQMWNIFWAEGELIERN